jgi:sterol desaturase/sphingolipid hydroxylase (fatty acid hydroxylase superfamily)
MSYLEIAVATFLFYNLRYLSFAYIYDLVCRNLFSKFKINPEPAKKRMIKKEIFWGSTVGLSYMPWMVLMVWMYRNGYTKIYTDVEQYGVLYIIVSTVLVFVLHDTYFFWFHYLFHKNNFLKKLSQHKVHHMFHNPTAFSAFATHPSESFMELGFRPLVLAFLPLHPYAIIAFLIISFILNCLGHSGYELFPSGFTKSPLTKFTGNSTHHYIHHTKTNYHFSLYFTWWDKIMGTEHPDYHEIFEQRASKNSISIYPLGFKIES